MPSSNHPSWGTSSAAVPTLEELQAQPITALSKGWSLLSAAVTLAGKAVAEKAMDPTLHENVKSYASTAQTYAAQAGKVALDTGRTANEWSKNQLGVDVADTVVGITDKAKGALGVSNHPGGGYESVGGAYSGWHDEDGTRLYADGDDDDFFDRHGAGTSAPITPATPGTANSRARLSGTITKGSFIY
jgi:ADP-ribosylation factor GTPase-activating protein 1